ncbi:MAG: efflux RND transporter periplasmic adaptor subunit [Flavobacteriaceae bacterium]|nr:efflux RND transporter periplasmic adaptor subunit [Bacteroidota bacterium]MDT8414756.1 efflux RND transporter periplasmic adaptor subunit [Flavobacteriaceae bacterium]
MKKTITTIVLLLVTVLFVGSLYYLYTKNKQSPVVFETEQPGMQTIVEKTISTGSIVPKEEVLIKPNISGIIQEVYVVAGELVKSGDLIAKIRVVPNVSNLNNAKAQVESAKIDLDNQTKIFNRQKSLIDKGVISQNDFDNALAAYEQSKQTYETALENYEIVRTGTAKGYETAANTMIRATVSGMVLEVPVKVGNQVIESNNFNEGTTIASIADINKMEFVGKVDESEVGKIKEGLPLEITVGAIENKKFDAILEYIAPKGLEENGAIQFEIKGSVKLSEDVFIRAGLSANASIILNKADSVLAVREAVLQFDPETNKPFVEIQTGEQQFEKREVELGISDGIQVEVKKGLSKSDKIKVWNTVQMGKVFTN